MEGRTPEDDADHYGGSSDEGHSPARFFSRRLSGQSAQHDHDYEDYGHDEPPEPPRRRRSPTLSALSGLLSFLLLVSLCGLFGVIWGATRLHAPGPLAADKILYIEPGTDVPDIVSMLNREGVITNPILFNAAVTLSGKRSKIKAGEYLFKQQASMHDVIDILVSGRQVLHSITIPEGLTSEQIVQRLKESDILAGDIRDIPKEGSLLPETYKVPRGMARGELIRRMQEDEKKLVEQIWAHRAGDLILHSPYELVTLASIVEKETGKPEERPHVAAVFLNRLQKKMRLQSDPTIVYGLVGGKGTLGRPILRSEVERPTPYNTYVISGLPPGPITNAGRAALEAVANPLHTPDLYFVADGTGGHIFSATLDQHNKNVLHWREIQKDAKEKAAAPDVFTPQPAAPSTTGRGNQHSELEDPAVPDESPSDPAVVYGALPAGFAAADTAGAVAPSLGLASAQSALAKVGPVLPPRLATALPQAPTNTASQNATKLASKTATKTAGLNLSPGLDQLGITVSGLRDEREAAVLLDGPVDPAANAANNEAAASAPPADAVPAAQTQTTPQTASQATAQTTPQTTPEATTGAAALTFDPKASPLPQQQASASQRRVVAFDASEGTALDPLRNKTYDLNYPKTVPTEVSVQ